MTFYGESYRLTQSTLDPAPITYHFDGASTTVEAGSSFVVAVDADPLELTDTDEAVVSWVIETGASSAGTLTVASGLDPDYALTEAVATEALGSFTVTGAQTVVAGPTSITTADLLSYIAEPTALITVTSGTVEVVQVKLRVWPPSGATGAWVTGPAWQRAESRVSRWYAAAAAATPQLPTYADAWDALRVEVMALDGQPGTEYSDTPGGDSVQSFFQVFDNFATAPFTPSGSAGASIALIEARPNVPLPDPSIAYGYDPREVWREQRSFIRTVGGGEAAAEFLVWDDAATLTVTDTYVGSIDKGSLPFDIVEHPSNPDWRLGSFYHPSTFTLRDGAIPLSDLGGMHVALAVMSPGFYDGPPVVDSFTDAAGTLSPSLPYQTSISGYEWFDPTAVAIQPRFFVRDRDLVDQPVGWGKTSDDVVFIIPTAMGRYRDMTVAEYAANPPPA